MSSSMIGNLHHTERENWWDKSNRLDSLSQQTNALQTVSGSGVNSFSSSLENILAKSNAVAANDGMDLAQAAPSSVSGEAVTFEELINSKNAQIREFAVLDQQPLSADWAILGNTNPVTPSNFQALQGLSDGLMLSQRFANAIYAAQ